MSKILSTKILYQHVFPQIPKGLDAVHLIGWVHRDIHPGDILILPPEAQICNFASRLLILKMLKKLDIIMALVVIVISWTYSMQDLYFVKSADMITVKSVRHLDLLPIKMMTYHST